MERFSELDIVWLLIASALIFMMQPGFAMLETGLTRAKNAGNVMMKNLMDFVIGSVAFWLIGYGLMQGAGNGLIGRIDLFSQGSYMPNGCPDALYLMYQVMYCATAATIVSGAMAERTKFSAYLICSFCFSAFLYPIEAHWIWGGGWLSKLQIGSAAGFLDCAGGTAVHTAGGITAFLGAAFLGPRIGKYDEKKKSNAIRGHSITLSTLGIFLLWFAWFGFNISSIKGISTPEKIGAAAEIFLVTNLCAASSAMTTLFLTWKRYRKPDIAMTLNGVLGGLVASTAGCNVLRPWSAVLTGVVAGILIVYGIEFIDKKLRVDDPVGASAAHGLCGIWGTLAVGLFHAEKGLFITGDISQLLVQAAGSLCVVLFTGAVMGAVLLILKKCSALRVSAQEEITGLDYGEHALKSAYGDFALSGAGEVRTGWGTGISSDLLMPGVHPEEMTQKEPPALAEGAPCEYGTINSVVVICKETMLESLKRELNRIGVMGITVSQVMGCGVQKGNVGYYRGSQADAFLLPKLRIEVVVSRVPVELVVDTVRKVLYTGKIGDGKIFVYRVENVIKVRTGEQGVKALQDPESYQELDD